MRRREDQPAKELAVSNKIDNGAATPARRTAGPMAARARALSKQHDQSRPRAWADRRDHDCHRLDDRVWHLHRFSGVIAIEWRAGLVVGRLGARWIADDDRRAVLLGTGNDDGASRRALEVGK